MKNKKIKLNTTIAKDLLKLGLISKKNIELFHNKTRDKKINVYQDKRSKIKFLEKIITSKNYYNKTDYRKITYLEKINKTRILEKYELVTEDDKRRANQFRSYTNKKDILDYGCGWGGFLTNNEKSRSLSGVELKDKCIFYIKKKFRKIAIQKDINNFNKKFDLITLFHVLEHIPHQIETLKNLRKKLKKNGKIIIEVPHSNDLLFRFNEFRDFSLWSEHLVLHTSQSLKKLLKNTGYKNIRVEYFQRYGFTNHMRWFLEKKPRGHDLYHKDYFDEKIDLNYKKILQKNKKTDTLIAIAGI